MPFIDLVMASTMSLDDLNFPVTYPKTTPGSKNRRKISGTMDCMIGAENEFNDPFASLNGDDSGNKDKVKTTKPATMVNVAYQNAFRSLAPTVSILGDFSASVSIGDVLFRRGSTTLSVIYQPRAIIRTLEIAVKK